MSNMKISIIIPAYNEEEYLPKLLESIEKQDFKDYEVIIADANSSDNTREIAESYGCTVVDGGLPGVGRNRGAAVAKGELLLFLDSDLELTEGYLENVVEDFEDLNLGIAITQMTALSEKKYVQALHTWCNWFMIASESIKPHGAGCYGIVARRELHEKVGGFDEDLDYGEDTDYIERIAEISNFKVLRNAYVIVSTRRLEEDGLLTLIKQYGKSTINDFRGKRTSADELGYSFEHESENSDYENHEDAISSIESHPKSDKQRLKIFYSVCGEGMGHAIRSSVIISHLIKNHDVYIFSSERAYKYLAEKFDNVYEIGGFNTVYENNEVNNVKTFLDALKVSPGDLKNGYRTLYKMARQVKPNIIISDFEIYANLLSKILNLPLISLDNIHMLAETEYEEPKKHKTDIFTANAVARIYIQNPKRYILTSFFFPPLKHPQKAAIYPPVLRDKILKLESEKGDHILVYQTSTSSLNIVEGLKAIDEKFIVYGFNKDETDGNLTFRSFNEDLIYEDMRTSKAVIVNGGFTTITEAIYLKKPVYSTPAHKNFEQILNGFYVEKLGYGEVHEDLDIDKLEKFLKRLDFYQKNLDKVEPWTNDAILKDLDESILKYAKTNYKHFHSFKHHRK